MTAGNLKTQTQDDAGGPRTTKTHQWPGIGHQRNTNSGAKSNWL